MRRQKPRWLARTPPALVLTLLLAILSGCFEDPVEQTLDVNLLVGGHSVITVRVKINDAGGESSPLAKRIAETRRELRDGTDEWSPRFAAVAPAAERFSWEKELGEVHAMRRAALLDQAADLESFFADTGVGVNWREGEGSGELSLFPSSPARASAKESAQMKDALATWSSALASYFEHSRALYAYLESHPRRAEACLGRLLREDLPEGKLDTLPAANDQEERLIESVRDAIARVADVLQVPETAAESLEEISHRVYDPFPAAVTVHTPGPILELEGFIANPTDRRPSAQATDSDAKTTVHIRRLGLWEALGSLRGKWLAPDPLLLHIEHQRHPEAPLDLGAVVAQRRRATAPSASAIEAALAAQLLPAPVYRVMWSKAGLAEDDEQALRRAWPLEP